MQETQTAIDTSASAIIKKDKKELETDDQGGFALRSLDDQLSFASKLMEQKMVSDTFKTPAQVVVAFQYAKAMRVNEILAVKMMYVVNGKPCLFGEGPLSLVQRTGLVNSMEEYFVDENIQRISVENKNLKAPVFASITRIGRRNDSLMQEDFFSLEDLERSGIDRGYQGKRKDVWDKWERIMMRYKARSMALRSKFADLIAGIPIAEYDYTFTPEMPDMKFDNKKTIADELNETYKEGMPTDAG